MLPCGEESRQHNVRRGNTPQSRSEDGLNGKRTAKPVLLFGETAERDFAFSFNTTRHFIDNITHVVL